MRHTLRSLLLLVLCGFIATAEHADEPRESYHPEPVAYTTVTGPPRGEDDNVAYYEEWTGQGPDEVIAMFITV